MTTRIMALLVISIIGCSNTASSQRSPLLTGLEGATLEIRGACELASHKCVQCHPVERILRAGVDSPIHWKRYVTRMRLQPGSDISHREADRITRCLVYRSFGDEGLSHLRGGAP